jgi:peptide/nickel transport system permease protein
LAIGSAFAVGIIAAMSFLGVGFRPPKPSWGSMIQAGATGVGSGEWWPVVFPALALAFVIWNLNLVADRLDRFYARLPA